LAAIPLQKHSLKDNVKISWDRYSIPFIQANNDEDLAYALGIVHAHLRWGQMELLRRVSQGRLAESAGPFATDLDKAIRVLGFERAAKQIEDAMPMKTKSFLGRFVGGINAYISGQNELAHEHKVLNIKPEVWTVRDVIVLSRLAATDVSWIDMASFILADDSHQAKKTFELIQSLDELSKSGSNSWVVDSKRSKSGKPIIANDPHLGFSIPNFWMLVGMKSPNHHAVGMSIPGLPFLALGRNQYISWGGTNMRAQSTDFVELSDNELEDIDTVKTTIKKRWWWDETFEFRYSEHGPLLNDVPFFKDKLEKPVAMKWRGHEASDEISALLGATKAKSVKEFFASFKGYAVSAQNFLVADVGGNTGMIRAAELPTREEGQSYPFIDVSEATKSWSQLLNPLTIPKVYNPKEGVIVSANDRPSFIAPLLSRNFAPNQRRDRILEYLRSSPKFSVSDFQKFQLDVFSQMSFDLKELFLEQGLVESKEGLEILRGWDGSYEVASKGAVFYQIYFSHLAKACLNSQEQRSSKSQLVMKHYLTRDSVDSCWLDSVQEAEKQALASRKKYPTWGDFHRMRVAHPLSNIPLVGSKYRFREFPIAGGVETVLKTAHGLEDGQHVARYGAQARHISDLADADSNYFVLFGGNDGWIQSENFLDQVDLWQKGELIQLPLTLENFNSIKTLVLEAKPL